MYYSLLRCVLIPRIQVYTFVSDSFMDVVLHVFYMLQERYIQATCWSDVHIDLS